MKRRNVIIGGVAALAVVLAWVLVVWSPQTKTLNASRTKAVAAERQTNSLRAELSRLKGLQANSAADQVTEGKLEAALPADADLADLLLQIHAAASAAGIAEVSVAPAPPASVTPTTPSAGASGGTSTAAAGAAASGSAGSAASGATGSAAAVSAAGKLQQVKLSLSVTGSATQLLDFIDRVNKLPRLILVDTVSFGGGTLSSTAALGKFTGSITAHAFVRPAAA